MDPKFDENDIRTFYRFLGHEKETNIRIPTNTGQKDFFVHGEDEFVDVCRKFSGEHNVYAGVNERELGGNNATSVKYINAVYVDVDPERKKGSAATEDELKLALNTVDMIRNDLLEFGISMKTMSGNGGQLFWKVTPIVLDEKNREEYQRLLKRFEKHLQNKYQTKEVKIDPVTADLARIMKVAGTMSVKGENTPERPHRLSRILAKGDEKTDIFEFMRGLPDIVAPKISLMDSGWEKLDNEKIREIFNNDKKLANCFDGRWEQYPEFDNRKRDGVEQYICHRLLEKKVPVAQIKEIMERCKVGKYQERVRDGYGEQYLKNIIDYARFGVQKVKEIKAMESSEAATAKEWKETVGEFIARYTDALDLAEQLHKIQPFFYDKARMIWMWDHSRLCWEMVDETDVLNAIEDRLESRPEITKTTVKNEFIEAIKQMGRRKMPRPMPNTWIQFKNRVIDIETGEEHKPTPEYFSTNPIPWSIVGSDETPELDKLFSEWVEKKWVPTLYEILAFCMVQDYFIQRAVVLCGSGSNGKGVFQDIVVKLIGQDNAISSELERLNRSRFESSKMYRKLVCIMGETNFSTFSDTNTFKRLTGRDFMDYEFKNKNPFTDKNYAKLLINTNSLPPTEDTTDGFHRRWLILDFPNKFTEKRQIMKELPDEMFDRLATKCLGIVKQLWLTRQFTNEGTITERRQRYEERSNPTGKFVKEAYTRDANSKIPYDEFYEHLSEFLESDGHRVPSRKEISKIIGILGLFTKKDTIKLPDGKKTTKSFIYGLRRSDKKEENTDNTDNTVVSIDFPYMEKSVNSGIIGIIGMPKPSKLSDFAISPQNRVLDFITKEGEKGAEIPKIFTFLADLTENQIEDCLGKLLEDGLIFEPSPGILRRI